MLLFLIQRVRRLGGTPAVDLALCRVAIGVDTVLDCCGGCSFSLVTGTTGFC